MNSPAYSESFDRGQVRSLRMGLFGGTFNPIHRGHIQVARDVLQKFALASIHFMPSALPPHKTRGVLATASDRYAMACMALDNEPAMLVSDAEIQRSGPSYTIDTLQQFRTGQPAGAELFFLVGLDAFLEIHTWKSFRRMFDLAAFIVMTRPHSIHPDATWRRSVMEFAQDHISADYRLSAQGDALIHPGKAPIHMVSVTPVAISSSQIRVMIRKGQSIENWVAPTVAAYIERKGLYR